MTNPHSATVGDKGRLTLPDDVRKHLGIRAGDAVIIELTDSGTAELIPATLIPKDQLWFAHPEMQARVQGAMDDIAQGRTTRVRTAAELQAHLDSLKGESQSD